MGNKTTVQDERIELIIENAVLPVLTNKFG